MRRLLLLAVLLSSLAGVACKRDAASTAAPDTAPPPALPATPPPPNDTPAGRRIEADLRALADDAMAGRETGTPGYDRAADYVAQRFAEIGLVPAGDDGSWFQRLPLLSRTRLAEGARLSLQRGGRTIELEYLAQFLPSTTGTDAEVDIQAPLVFVAHAIHAPELGHDDFAGLDLAGKIVVAFPDAPDTFADDTRAYHSSQATKAAAIAARGAVGWILLPTPSFAARVPWDALRSAAGKPGLSLVDDDGGIVDGHPSMRIGAVVNVTAADLLFDGTGKTAAELFEAARQGQARGFDLPGTARIAARAKVERIASHNVIGRLPGSDPALAGEHIAYTAHLDHIGIGQAVDGDRIHNGALDNALGVAILLETARTLQSAQAGPKRSSLFIALGAEEQGLLGSRWFVHRPTVPRASLVANLNMDMPVLTAPTTDVVPIGAEHSTLQAALEQAARDLGVALSPDPFPEEVAFVRSDQFSFVRAGIPAVYLTGGVVAANAQQDPRLAATWFMRNCYHRPCDDADLPIHYGDAARLARLNARIGQIVGDAPQRPRWNEGDFFGVLFGGAAEHGPSP